MSAERKSDFTWKETVTTDGVWLPSPQHCRVQRMLTSYTTGLDELIAHLRAAAEGLDSPSFTDYDNDDGEDWYGPGVSGFRLRTPEEHTAAERRLLDLHERELEELARLKEKYEPAAARDQGGDPQ